MTTTKESQCKKVTNLLLKLAEDPSFADEYSKHPRTVLEEAGIEGKLAYVIASGDLPAIIKVLDDTCGPGRIFIV
jgi:hypothetical protein